MKANEEYNKFMEELKNAEEIKSEDLNAYLAKAQKEPTEEEKKEDEDRKYCFIFEDFCKEAGLILKEDWEFVLGETDSDGNETKKGGRNYFKSGAVKIGKLLEKKGYAGEIDEDKD